VIQVRKRGSRRTYKPLDGLENRATRHVNEDCPSGVLSHRQKEIHDRSWSGYLKVVNTSTTATRGTKFVIESSGSLEYRSVDAVDVAFQPIEKWEAHMYTNGGMNRGECDFDVVSLKSRCRKGGAWPPTTQRSHATYSQRNTEGKSASHRCRRWFVQKSHSCQLFMGYELYLLTHVKVKSPSKASRCCIVRSGKIHSSVRPEEIWIRSETALELNISPDKVIRIVIDVKITFCSCPSCWARDRGDGISTCARNRRIRQTAYQRTPNQTNHTRRFLICARGFFC
jgi:hypothetical protein